MTKSSLVALFILSALTSGCATRGPETYARADQDEESRARKFAFCRERATGSGVLSQGGLMGLSSYNQMLDDCMRADGYTRPPY